MTSRLRARVLGIVAYARETWRNDGAEGETVPALCAALEEAYGQIDHLLKVQDEHLQLLSERDMLRKEVEAVDAVSVFVCGRHRALHHLPRRYLASDGPASGQDRGAPGKGLWVYRLRKPVPEQP